MAHGILSPASSETQYRRGTVMGLTVAEAFMLVAFVLLMLLLFWRYEVREDVEFARQVTPDKRKALIGGHVLVAPERLAILVEREGLVADPARRALAEEAAKLTPDGLRKLTNMARDPAALADRGTRVSPERLDQLERFEQRLAGRSPREAASALEVRDALDPYGEDSNEALLERIAELQAQRSLVDARLAEEAQARKDFVERMRHQLDGSVRALGGRIDATGRIVFPETVFFGAGRAAIVPQFGGLLDDFCPRWLDTLREGREKLDVEDIRIEGHSSPEWQGASSAQEAWIENLKLSQQRAQSVLVYCLRAIGPKPLGDWARNKLTAVGYSSSRPVMSGAAEDWAKSRRVVFGHDFNRGKLIAEIGDVSKAEVGAIKPISGNARVIDADTIKIGNIGIRLDGIDAPELDQVCTKNGMEWLCGREAGRALKWRIGDRAVICDNLHPGLRRLRGRCRVEGEDGELNRWAVNAGWAFAFTKYSDEYTPDEAVAREAKRGIWAGDPPMRPQEWRRRYR